MQFIHLNVAFQVTVRKLVEYLPSSICVRKNITQEVRTLGFAQALHDLCNVGQVRISWEKTHLQIAWQQYEYWKAL